MSALLILCMILPLAVGICAALDCRMEEALPLSLFVMIAAGYAVTLAGGLWLTGGLVWLLSLAGGGFAVYRFVVKKAVPVTVLLKGTGIFLLFAAFFWWLCRGCAFTDWDDFSHWGKAVKWMYYTDTLYTAPASTDAFKSYPPATAILQYMILKAGGFSFREDIVLYANALLTAAMLTLSFRAVHFRSRPVRAAAMAALLAFLPVLVYPSYFFRASVDGLLGLLSGMLIVSVFLPGRTRASDWLETLGCLVLALVKSSGTGLAVLAALTVLLLRSAKEKRLTGVFPLGAVLVAKCSWSLHLSIVGAGERMQWPGGWTGGIFSLLTGRADAWRYEVLQNFSETIFRQGNYGAGQWIPFAAIPATLAVTAAIALISCEREERRNRKKAILFLTGAALGITLVFVLTLLYSYLYLFNQAEAMYLASVYRYLDTCTMLMAYTMVVLMGAFSGCRKMPLSALPAAVPLMLAVLFPADGLPAAILNAPIHAAQTQNDRILARHAAQRIQALGEKSPRLQLITANDAGAAALKIDYELLPVCLPEQSTILMADNSSGQLGVCEISAEEWSTELARRFDYVYIYCPEDQFVADYQSVFEDDSQIVVDRMFRVIAQPDGTAKLRCMDE